MTEPTHETTLQAIQDALRKRGDMPIFNTSMNRIQAVGSDPDADAMALSVEVMKDVNLTAKVLRLANSPMYNRGKGKIAQLSRAVVVLGFGPIKNAALTAKFIDGFQLEYPGVNMTGMLVNSFLAGTFVRNVAAKCGIADIEQAYICGLLHNLGEIVTAYTLPAQYKQIKKLQQEKNLPAVEAEKQVLGTTLRAIGQSVAREWEFPLSVVSTMEEHPTGKAQRIRNQAELTGALVSLANKTMGMLYADKPEHDQSMAELMLELSKTSGIRKEDITTALTQSFRDSCELAQSYGLDRKQLAPKLRDSADEDLDKLTREMSFYATSTVPAAAPAPEPSARPVAVGEAAPAAASKPAPSTAPGGDANVLLSVLFELTTLISQKSNYNTILDKVLEGMHRGIGFDRAVLCLLSPDHKLYSGRLYAGDGAKLVKDYFNFPVNKAADVFSRTIMEGNELFVENVEQGWADQLPPRFAEKVGAQSFILGTLLSKSRPLGVFYADKARSGAPITATDRRSFMQLVAQAQLALQVR
jgi:HD-like signal output (HDOD) protein